MIKLLERAWTALPRHERDHSWRTARLALSIGKRLGIGEAELTDVWRGAILHDIGKAWVPRDILLKPSALTDIEAATVHRHPERGWELLRAYPSFASILDIVLHHHERWNGSGYPHGLRGEAIPLTARIVAVADVWDALRTDRPYEPAWDEERALTFLQDRAGELFDPMIVVAFVTRVAMKYWG